MKKYLIASLVLSVSTLSMAQEQAAPAASPAPAVTATPAAPAVTQERNGRQGFFLGFGLGGGGIHVGGNGRDLNRGAGFGSLRIGAGISESVLLMAETFSSTTKKNGVTTSANTVNFSAQFFVNNGFYVRPGIGFAALHSSTTSGSTTTTTSSDAGFSAMMSEGYEFRMGRSFALSPELTLNYDRVNKSNIMNYGAMIGLLWYFR